MNQFASHDKAKRRITIGLAALLVLIVIWAFFALTEVTLPLVWWLLLFVAINGVLYGVESLAAFLLLVATKLGIWPPLDEKSR